METLSPRDDAARQLHLFEQAGARLPVQRRPRRLGRLHRIPVERAIPGVGLRLHRVLVLARQPRGSRPREPEQLWLDLDDPSARVMRLAPRACSAFLGARLTGLFRRSRQLHAAALALKEGGVLYVGDLIRLPRWDLEARLGVHGPRLREIERELMALGLPLQARAPWWSRPADPYALS